MLLRSDGLLHTLLKRELEKGTSSANTLRPALLGYHRANQPGSPASSIPKEFSPCWLGYRTPLSDHGLEFPAGTRAGFAKATAHTHGIGVRWRSLCGSR